MLKNYIKIAFKVFLRGKFFTFISLFGISFTLAVLIVATSFLDHFFGPFPPEVKLNRTLFVFRIIPEYRPGEEGSSISYEISPFFAEEYLHPLHHVETVSIFTIETDNITHFSSRGEKVNSELKYTDADFWQILEFDFLEGSGFTAQDLEQARHVAVINEATRGKVFGDEPAVGRVIMVDDQSFTVVGVVANVPIFRFVPYADIWIPYSTSGRFKDKRSIGGMQQLCGDFGAMILAEDQRDLSGIQEEYRHRLAGLKFPEHPVLGVHGHAESTFDTASRLIFPLEEVRWSRLFLLGTIISCMVLFMLLPAVNLINLSISRTMERASEIGVRKAFGASSRTLVGQFVVENVLLTLIGGVVGLAGAFLILRFIAAIDLIPYARFHMNLRIFGYGMLLAFFFGIFSGVYPAWKMSRLHPVAALQRRKK